eukprot:CAMPEP_0197399348 /NCGR_PEP_ID=MMETSP1165-20131217/15013_1 /TAXON_ID=284809 /ORGANISM="Chrysocystis fragilis, Strain CCMP3189" /LENGTH=80 /DNA_ID=CAMNT_0042925343 /DNA_START=56 /DNA_END=298 /DNA_ORIENTATION=+
MKPNEKTPEQKRAELEAKHGATIRAARAQREAMERYFQNLKHSQRGDVADPEQEERMASVLTQGKSHVVRHYAYDDGDSR